LGVRTLHAGLACLSVLGLAACGDPRQDANEQKGTYHVTADGSFPSDQSLAKKSELEIRVRNEENRKTIPNVAVTVLGFDTRIKQQNVADPTRPVFVINGQPAQIGGFPESREAGPRGGETAYVGTWALGPLPAGKTKTFRWSVTAVRAGPYKLTYRVQAGLNGKARAVSVTGNLPVGGTFTGEVNGKAPQTRVAEDGKTVVRGTR